MSIQKRGVTVKR